LADRKDSVCINSSRNYAATERRAEAAPLTTPGVSEVRDYFDLIYKLEHELPPDAIEDIIAAGVQGLINEGNPAQLQATAQRLSDFIQDVSQFHSIKIGGASKFKLLSDGDLEALPDPVSIVEGVAFADNLISVVGQPGTYKTFILLELAFCIAVGADWHGRRVKQGPVVYIAAEGRHGIGKRFRACKAAYQYTGATDVLFLPESVLIDTAGDVAELVQAITNQLPAAPVAVMIDTLNRNMEGDESKTKEMGLFVRGCDSIRKLTGASVFIAHHTGWEFQRSRGSISLPAAVDTEILLLKDDWRVTLKCTKQKDAEEFSPIELEAFSIAGSLALRTFVPTGANLTRNERVALSAVQTPSGLTATQWLELTGLPRASFHNARRHLLALSYVKHAKHLYVITEAGAQAIGSTLKFGITETQAGKLEVVHSTPQVFRPEDCTTELGVGR